MRGLADVVAMLDRHLCGCGHPGMRSKDNIIMETSTNWVIDSQMVSRLGVLSFLHLSTYRTWLSIDPRSSIHYQQLNQSSLYDSFHFSCIISKLFSFTNVALAVAMFASLRERYSLLTQEEASQDENSSNNIEDSSSPIYKNSLIEQYPASAGKLSITKLVIIQIAILVVYTLLLGAIGSFSFPNAFRKSKNPYDLKCTSHTVMRKNLYAVW